MHLVICPACSSRLIYPIDLAGWKQNAVVSRRCPECEHRDVVVAARLLALLWLARTVRQRDKLAAHVSVDTIGSELAGLEAHLGALAKAAEALRLGSAADGRPRNASQ